MSILKAVIAVDPDAPQIARQLDKERKDDRVRSKLHGVPVLVNDVDIIQDFQHHVALTNGRT